MSEPKSFAVAYGMNKKAKKNSKAASKSVSEDDKMACDEHGEMDCAMCDGGMMAEGGDVVDQAMSKRWAKGGEVEDLAGFDSNDFDEADDHEVPTTANYTGENSGDMLGDHQTDMDRDEDADMIARIMKKRKQHNPSPA